jgi:glycosyltransferase involved in cell wall biosynthesis
MKVLMINIIKPIKGSGDGTTEYSYQLYQKLKSKGKASVSIEYFLDKAKRNNTIGLMHVYSQMAHKAAMIARQNYDIIHIMSHEIGSMAKLLKQNGTQARIITTVHDTTRLEKGLHKGLLQKSYNLIVKNNVSDALRYSDAIIFVSERARRETLKKLGPLKVKSYVIMHGLREELFTAPIPKKRKGEFLTVGYIGSMAHHKNVIMILKAARIAKEKGLKARFLIYGTGFESENLQKFKKRYNLDNVSFRGFAPEDEIVGIYDSFDAFVFPSLYEGFGFHILEAQSRGLPVIILKNTIIPEEVKKYAIEVADEKELIDKLKDIQKNEYKKWKQAAMAYAKKFTWRKTALSIERAYRKYTG